MVGIADMKMCRIEGTLITYALGSCIGICLYDPVIKLAGMIHIMLPENTGSDLSNAFKYADTGIRETIRKMTTFGAMKNRITAKIAGGAKMFDLKGSGTIGNIGERNIISVRSLLRAEGIRIISEDVGFNYARTMSFDAANGAVKIRSFGKPDKQL